MGKLIPFSFRMILKKGKSNTQRTGLQRTGFDVLTQNTNMKGFPSTGSWGRMFERIYIWSGMLEFSWTRHSVSRRLFKPNGPLEKKGKILWLMAAIGRGDQPTILICSVFWIFTYTFTIEFKAFMSVDISVWGKRHGVLPPLRRVRSTSMMVWDFLLMWMSFLGFEKKHMEGKRRRGNTHGCASWDDPPSRCHTSKHHRRAW